MNSTKDISLAEVSPVQVNTTRNAHPEGQVVDDDPCFLIGPRRFSLLSQMAEVWRFRELLFFLAWRDVIVRYKQTVLGVLWALVQPLLSMVVFTVILGNIVGLKAQTGAVPYSLNTFAGLLPWLLFSNSISNSSSSLIGGSSLITKVYFPRIIMALAPIGVGLVDFLISVFLLAAMLIYYGISPSWGWLCAPILLSLILLFTTGMCIFTAALTAQYRDFRHIIPFGLQLWMFVTPVIYPSSIIPARFQWLQVFNPIGCLIEGFRATLFDKPIHLERVAIAGCLAVVVCLLGVVFFGKVDRRLADII